MKTPKLINAVEMNHQYPSTFYLPPQKKVANVKKGSVVKVSNATERFWVSVMKRTGNVVIGKINNHLFGQNLKKGDIIKFYLDNVCDIYPSKKHLTSSVK